MNTDRIFYIANLKLNSYLYWFNNLAPFSFHLLLFLFFCVLPMPHVVQIMFSSVQAVRDLGNWEMLGTVVGCCVCTVRQAPPFHVCTCTVGSTQCSGQVCGL